MTVPAFGHSLKGTVPSPLLTVLFGTVSPVGIVPGLYRTLDTGPPPFRRVDQCPSWRGPIPKQHERRDHPRGRHGTRNVDAKTVNGGETWSRGRHGGIQTRLGGAASPPPMWDSVHRIGVLPKRGVRFGSDSPQRRSCPISRRRRPLLRASRCGRSPEARMASSFPLIDSTLSRWNLTPIIAPTNLLPRFLPVWIARTPCSRWICRSEQREPGEATGSFSVSFRVPSLPWGHPRLRRSLARRRRHESTKEKARGGVVSRDTPPRSWSGNG